MFKQCITWTINMPRHNRVKKKGQMCRLQEKNCNNTFVHSFPLVDLTFTYFVYRESKRPFKDRMPIRVWHSIFKKPCTNVKERICFVSCPIESK